VVLKWFLSLTPCYSWGCEDDVSDDSLLLVAVDEMRCMQQLTIARNQEQKKTATTTPQPFYGPFSGTTRVSQCHERTSGLYDTMGLGD